ncbi:MAG TPA: hypothetical protein VKE41_13040 [Roseiflexaceae bacterium]|nr:hypothetical protein [Roseiflexaceae bacterium]
MRLPIVVALILLLVSCGATPAPLYGMDLPEPCTLLTIDEVAAALGEPVKQPQSEHELLDAECSYDALAAQSHRSVLVELTTAGPDSASFEQRAQFFQTEGARQIGSGGGATYAKRGAILTHKPGIILFLIVTDDTRTEEAIFAVAQKLANKVLTRLP